MGDPELKNKGDVAQSWELSPDKLTLTMKINPNAKWSPPSAFLSQVVPQAVFNRQIDSDDVLTSWDVLGTNGLGRFELNNAASPVAPITSVTAPDKSTVVFKLNKPDSAILMTMSVSNVGYFYLVPKEAKTYEYKKAMLGSGPFYIDEYVPSSRMAFKRNPNLELRDEQKRPYLDAVTAVILNDPAQGQAQFRSGAFTGTVDGFAPLGVTANDILPLKKDLPDLSLYQLPVGSDPQKMTFGGYSGVDSPFKDKRMRQAMMYAWDRDLYIDTIYNVPKFEAEGIAMETRYNAMMPNSTQGYPGGTYAPYYLNPQSKDFGANAKYFGSGDRTKDLTEAKALIKAVTGKDTWEFEHLWSLPNSFGPGTQTAVEVITAMMKEAGLVATIKNLTTPEWLDKVQAKGGTYGNAVVTAIDSGGPDPANYLFQHYHPQGTRFYAQGTPGDSRLTADIEKMKGEFDSAKRVQIAHDLQRYDAEQVFERRYMGGTNTFTLAWPAVQNGLVWRSDFPRQWANIWFDTTKKPFSKT
ncbi:MAG TPA: ABC transporter substrate-binding protein [Dehalococcoidia bacterium]|nr:ABC transporter substrate-binding protein [Dehalococcoidia bacterium]